MGGIDTRHVWAYRVSYESAAGGGAERSAAGGFWKLTESCARVFRSLLQRLSERMAAVKALNPKAEVARAHAALAVNISAARGLQDVLKSNLGPKGTMKM